MRIEFREPLGDGVVTLRRLRAEDAPAYAAATDSGNADLLSGLGWSSSGGRRRRR